MRNKTTGSLDFGFPDQSQSFTNGFEAGMTYAKLLLRPEILDTDNGFPKRIENAAVYKAMAESLGYDVGFQEVQCKGGSPEYKEEINKEWVNIVFLEKRK